jgi:hypothetical protein
MNMGIRLYNKITNKIREVGKMRQFKRAFRSYLVQYVLFDRGIYVKIISYRNMNCMLTYV